MKKIMKRFLSLLLVPVLILTLCMPVMASGSDDSYIFGSAQFYSTYTPETLLSDSFFFTEEWFWEDPSVRNDSLALLSMQLTAAGVLLESGSPVDDFLGSLGFENTGFSSPGHEDPQSCNYTWATKTITKGDETRTLAAVIIQSYTSDQPERSYGWTQNFAVNGDYPEGDHYALSAAAYSILDDVASLDDAGNTTFWIMGHSRGGAIADLIAAHLPEADPAAAGNIYAYTFESPKTADGAYVPDNEAAYGYIHNYITGDDAITEIPPWNMIRYGVDHQLDTEETNAGLFSNLREIGSHADEMEDSYEPVRNVLFHIIDALGYRLPDRADYSAVNTDMVIDPSGTEIEVVYVYQDTLARTVGAVSSGGFDGFSLDVLTNHADELLPILSALAMGVKYDSPDNYWTAASGISDFLDAAGLAIPLSKTDFYALLKLAGPYLIRAENVPDQPPESLSDILLFANMDVLSLASPGALIFSHHFDVVIARLMTLAEYPLLEDIDITIPEPQAGDDVSAAPSAVLKDILSRDSDWLSVSSEWNTEDEFLADNGVCYLTVELKAVGHKAPDDFRLTLNGAGPVETPETSYENGILTVTAAYAFSFGELDKVTVFFDAAGRAADPEPVQVDKGALLRTVLEPVSPGDVADREVIWKFVEWKKDDGSSWSDVIASGDVTLEAEWKGCIEDVALTFDIPHVGEGARSVGTPDGVRYRVAESDILTAAYTDAPAVLEEEEYILTLRLVPISEDLSFLSEEDEYGFYDYTGTITMNGEPISCNFEREVNMISVEYTFSTLSQEITPQEITYSCVSGNGNEWTKGSQTGSSFTFSRSEEDNTAITHFKGVKTDGADLAETDYTAEAGSVIISLSPVYLETLSAGEHILTAFFDDGSADAVFTILPAEKDEEKDDGDDSGKTDDSGKDDGKKDDSGKTDDSGKDDGKKDDSGKTDDRGRDDGKKDSSGKSGSGSSGKAGSGSGGSTTTVRVSSGNTARSNSAISVKKTASASAASGSGTVKGRTAANTGDESRTLFWTALMLIAACVICKISVQGQ